jgi:uncharacterized protein with FMN-binding domain
MLALAASVAATGGVALGLAYTEGAFVDVAEKQDVSLADPQQNAQQNAAATATDGATQNTQAPSTAQSEPTEIVDGERATPDAITTPTSSADGVYLGGAEYTMWGDVQVEVTVSSGKIVDVVAVQIPGGRLSTAINDQAEPLLEAQAIEIQAADLDIVSGATYTSIAYAGSLQAALDQAAFAEAQSLAGATSRMTFGGI